MIYQARKALADILSGGARSILVVFALALGIWGLGSVLVSYAILNRDLRTNFLSTIPAHAVVNLSVPSSVDLGALKSKPAVESAEYRDFALLRIEVGKDEWIPLWLFGVSDFRELNLAKFFPQEGGFVPPEGSIVIERNGKLISDLSIGALARIRSGARNLTAPVTGVVFDPGQAPATQDHFIYAYTDRATWSQITGQPALKRLIVRFHDVHSKGDVERASAFLGGSGTVEVPPFLQHPHQWQLDMLLGIIGAIGFLAFLLSSVLVSQVVAALLARQVRQIAILKAIGASRARVTGLYVLYLLFFALASGTLAVPLSIMTAKDFSAFCAGILNFDILTKVVPAETLALLCGAALILPFIFAAPTLARAGGIAVREALGETKARTRGRIGLRTLVTAFAIALGVAIFATGFNLRQSLYDFLATTRKAMRFDVQVVLTEPIPRADFEAVFAGLDGIAATEAWVGGRGELQTRIAGTDGGIGIVALPPDTRMASPRISAGRWLRPAATPEVVLNQSALSLFPGAKVGDGLGLRIGGQDRRVRLVGIAEEIDKPKIYLADSVYSSWSALGDRVNTLSFIASDQGWKGVMGLKRAIETRVSASSLSVLYVMSQAERTKIIADHLDIILAVLTIVSFLVLLVSALGMASATSITVFERSREVGILRALGATPRKIVARFVAEGLHVGLAGLLLGLLLSWPLSVAASAFFGTLMLGEGAVLRSAFSLPGFVVTVPISLVFAWLASRIPASSALGISARAALAYE